MFLDRLIARATGRLPVLKTDPALARELAHPAYAAPPEPEIDNTGAIAPVAEHLARPAPAQHGTPAPIHNAAAAMARPAVSVGHEPSRLGSVSPVTPEATTAETPASPAPRRAGAAPPPPEQAAIRPLDQTPRLRPPDSGPPPNGQPVIATTGAVLATARSDPVQPAAAPAARGESLAQSPDRPTTDQQLGPQPLPQPLPQPEAFEIHVEIGRIDLVSPPPARPQPATSNRFSRPGPHLTLSDYLDRRRGSR